ncbi:FK506-binding protein 15-like isoform X5 [Tachypleus tridentatus]|uniref:FK506-binding protein 15-like isoform X4 n=2 Tax=Tachypleus tridentatus TaxID=6853 RepID=UPI003FD1DD65
MIPFISGDFISSWSSFSKTESNISTTKTCIMLSLGGLGTDDDEDVDFNLSFEGGSRLASMFSDGTSQHHDSQSLMYTAPKQPKKTDSALGGQNATTTSVLYAVAVHSFKFEGGKHTNQGKVGLAIIGNHELPMYKLLLYKGKQQQVTSANISQSFRFTVQQNKYAYFYDHQRSSWTVLFESEDNQIEFAKQVALARANIAGSGLNSVIIQDLAIGEGPSLEVGHVAEVRSTGWLMTNHTFGQVFHSDSDSEKLMRIKLGKSKVIKGLEEGLIGCKKNGRRLLIIPPSLGYGSTTVDNKIPPNSILIFEVQVKKMKSKDISRSSTPVVDSDASDGKKPEIPSKPHTHSVSSEDSVRARGASLSEQMSQSPKSDKAQIISRVAKLGMSLLPVAGQLSSESDIEGDHPRSSVSPPPVLPLSHQPLEQRKLKSSSTLNPNLVHSFQPGVTQALPQTHQSVAVTNHQMALYQPAVTHQQQYPGSLPYSYSFQQPVAPPLGVLPQQQSFPMTSVSGINPPLDNQLPVLLAETRTQNTELRLSLGKIADKVDLLLNKMEDIKSNQSQAVVGATYMETSILLQNIQRIVQENSRLKNDVDDKNTKIQTLNEKICDLLQKNQKFMEQSNSMLEQRSDSLHTSTTNSQARLLTLEQEKAKLAVEYGEAVSKINYLEIQMKQQESELHQRLQVADSEVLRYKEQLEKLKDQLSEREGELKVVQHSLREAQKHKKDLEEHCTDLQETNQSLEKNLTDKKQKLIEGQKKVEEEMEEIRLLHKKEVESLRSRILKQESEPAVEKMNQLEEEINRVWEQKHKKELEEIITKHQHDLKCIEAEKEELRQKVNQLENKVELIQTTEELMKEPEEWKSKHEILLANCQTMKEQYELKIASLMKVIQEFQENATDTSGEESFENELKKVMNTVYRLLQAAFEEDEQYTRDVILMTLLNTIRNVTLEVIQSRRKPILVEHEAVDETDKGKAPLPHVEKEENTTDTAYTDTRNEKEREMDHEVDPRDSNNQVSDEIVSDPTDSNKQVSDEIVSAETNFKHDDAEHNEFQTDKNIDANDSSPQGKDNNQQSDSVSHVCDNSIKQGDTDKFEDTIEGTKETEQHIKEGDNKKDEQKIFEDHINSSRKPLMDGVPNQEDMKWKPQPPPPPLFDEDDEEEDDDWLK